MKNKIIIIILAFFSFVNIILVVCAFNITPLTIRRDTFIYEYGSEIQTSPQYYINANEAILSQVVLNFSDLKNEIGVFKGEGEEKETYKIFTEKGSYVERIIVEDQAGNQSASLRVKIVAGQNGNNPTLTGIDNIEILKGSSFNALEGVEATDGSGNDITEKIKILKNNVNVNEVGEYEVIYSVTNDKGHTLQRTRRVTVVQSEKAGR